MATNPNAGGGAPALPLNLLAQAVPMLTRHELAALTERLIERLDLLDGDPDQEDDDPDEEDDPAGQSDEDGWNTGSGIFAIQGDIMDGPGCYISEEGI